MKCCKVPLSKRIDSPLDMRFRGEKHVLFSTDENTFKLDSTVGLTENIYAL
jgi:hypothetical protein